MKRTVCCCLLAAVLLGAGAAQAAEEVRFVTCPVYRDVDAGRKSGCWLGDHYEGGVRYDISLSPTKPVLGNAVLVEGIPASDFSTQACGSPVLHPVRVSILPGNCVEHMLPEESYAGHSFSLPSRNVRPLYEEREPPAEPYEEKTFFLPFDFGRDFITYQLTDYYMDKASKYALDTDAQRVEITSYAVTEESEVSGRVLQESSELAQARADKVVEWLRRLGYPTERIVIHTDTNPEPVDMEGADGLTEPSRRRVEVRVIP